MENYLDNTYAALDHVILSYRGNDGSLAVPGRLAGMEIRTIGDGAFMESDQLRHVTIPQSVDRIGRSAFAACKRLKDVSFYASVQEIGELAFCSEQLSGLRVFDLELSEARYRSWLSSSVIVQGTLRVLPAFPDLPILKTACAAVNTVPASGIPSGIGQLFFQSDVKDETGMQSLFRQRNGFGPDFATRGQSEYDSFFRMLHADQPVLPDRESEKQNDLFLKKEQYPPLQKTAVFTFDDSLTKQRQGMRLITAYIRISCFFWQSATPVLYCGKQYYIYNRNYLLSASDPRYLRKETAVFTADDLVRNREEALNVYAKYKLLCIL